MKSTNRKLAALELLLIFPASLFMGALFLREVQPPPYQPAQSARWIVDWFAARPHFGLGVLLIAMPLVAFVIGGLSLLRGWRADAEFRQSALTVLRVLRSNMTTLIISGATVMAAGIVAIVALHMITD